MRPHLAWIILTCAGAATLWQLVIPQPLLNPLAAGLVLLLVGILSGIRLATDSLGLLLKDLITLNKHQTERNEDLADMNVMMLRELVSLTEDNSDQASSNAKESFKSADLAEVSQKLD